MRSKKKTRVKISTTQMDATLQDKIRAAGHIVGKVVAAIRGGKVFIEDFAALSVEDTKFYLDDILATAGKIKCS
jgi:hypothetical protein